MEDFIRDTFYHAFRQPKRKSKKHQETKKKATVFDIKKTVEITANDSRRGTDVKVEYEQ